MPIKMTQKRAINILIWIVGAILLLHVAIVTKVIPYEIAWGGKLKCDTQMYLFESISILVTLLLGIILLIKGNYVPLFIPISIVNALLWVFFVLFGLNAAGNLLAETLFEKSLSVLTLCITYLIWKICKGNKPSSTKV